MNNFFFLTAVDYQMIRNVGMLGISLKEKSVKVGIYPWQVAKSMHYGILIQFYFYIRF
jgi:hypothetical protein